MTSPWLNALTDEIDATVLAEELRELSDGAVLLLNALSDYELHMRGWKPAALRGWRRFIQRKAKAGTK